MIRSPDNINARSLELHRETVAKIKADPALFERVVANNVRHGEIVSPRSQPYVVRWHQLIEAGIESCLAKAIEESDEGRLLRSASPFAGILTEDERLAVFARWSGRSLESVKREVEAGLNRLEEAEARFAASQAKDGYRPTGK